MHFPTRQLCLSGRHDLSSRDNLSSRTSCEKYFSTRVMSTVLDMTVSSRLEKLTSLIRFLEGSSDSDDRIDILRVDQMIGLGRPGYVCHKQHSKI